MVYDRFPIAFENWEDGLRGISFGVHIMPGLSACILGIERSKRYPRQSHYIPSPRSSIVHVYVGID